MNTKKREILIISRKKKEFTQEQVSKICNISRSNYCMIENGTRKPTLETALKLSALFGIEVNLLL